MKRTILIYIFLLQLFACAGVALVPASAETIMSEVQRTKGTHAVLLNVWATSCAPCVAEFPAIVELGENNSKLHVLFVSTDFPEYEIATKALDSVLVNSSHRIIYCESELKNPK